MMHRQWVRLLSDDPFLRLDSQVQLQLAVYPVHPLVIPAVALDVAQEQEAQAESPVALIRGQPDQPVGNLGILIAQQPLITVAGFADAIGLAGEPDADAPFRDSLPC